MLSCQVRSSIFLLIQLFMCAYYWIYLHAFVLWRHEPYNCPPTADQEADNNGLASSNSVIPSVTLQVIYGYIKLQECIVFRSYTFLVFSCLSDDNCLIKYVLSNISPATIITCNQYYYNSMITERSNFIGCTSF